MSDNIFFDSAEQITEYIKVPVVLKYPADILLSAETDNLTMATIHRAHNITRGDIYSQPQHPASDQPSEDIHT